GETAPPGSPSRALPTRRVRTSCGAASFPALHCRRSSQFLVDDAEREIGGALERKTAPRDPMFVEAGRAHCGSDVGTHAKTLRPAWQPSEGCIYDTEQQRRFSRPSAVPQHPDAQG